MPADMAADKVASYGRGGAGTEDISFLLDHIVLLLLEASLLPEPNLRCTQETSVPQSPHHLRTSSPPPSKATCTPPAAAAKATWRKTTQTGQNWRARVKTSLACPDG